MQINSLSAKIALSEFLLSRQLFFIHISGINLHYMNILGFLLNLALVEFRTNGIHIKRGLGVLMLIPTWAITTVTKGVLDRLIKGHCI